MVAPDRLRFDYSHPKALTHDDIAAIEAEVNAEIRANQPVTTRLMTPDDAVAAGALALFGEKYGDEVRVLSMGRNTDKHYSVELCGGTHVDATGDIAIFKIIAESAVSSGIRRIEALTGDGARTWFNARDEKLRQAAAALKSSPDEVPARVTALVETARRLERELAEAKKALAMGGGSANSEQAGPEQVAGYAFLGQIVDGLDPKNLRGEVDAMKQRLGSGIAALIATNDGRASVAFLGHRRLHRLRGRPRQCGGRGARRPGPRRPSRLAQVATDCAKRRSPSSLRERDLNSSPERGGGPFETWWRAASLTI